MRVDEERKVIANPQTHKLLLLERAVPLPCYQDRDLRANAHRS